MNSHFKLGADIDLTAYLNVGGIGYNNGKGWEPIGNNLSPFTGSMDGSGYRISGLKIDRQFNLDIGLFGRTKGKLENISLEQIDVAGEKFVGGLAGTNEGIITNSDVSGMVLGSVTSAGGLIGENAAGTITESYATVGVTGGAVTLVVWWAIQKAEQSWTVMPQVRCMEMIRSAAWWAKIMEVRSRIVMPQVMRL